MKVTSREVVYECPIFKIEERKVVTRNNDLKTFWTMVRPPNVGVIGITNDKKIVLIKEELGEESRECLLLPGGKVDKYNATEEEIQNQALQELLEESGYNANNVELLSKESTPWNTLDRDFYRFIAWDLEDVGQELESGEYITRFLVSVEEAEKLIQERRMTSPEEERALEKALKVFKVKGLLEKVIDYRNLYT